MMPLFTVLLSNVTFTITIFIRAETFYLYYRLLFQGVKLQNYINKNQNNKTLAINKRQSIEVFFLQKLIAG